MLEIATLCRTYVQEVHTHENDTCLAALSMVSMHSGSMQRPRAALDMATDTSVAVNIRSTGDPQKPAILQLQVSGGMLVQMNQCVEACNDVEWQSWPSGVMHIGSVELGNLLMEVLQAFWECISRVRVRRQRGVVASALGHVLPERCAAVPPLTIPPRIQQEVLDRNALLFQRCVYSKESIGIRTAYAGCGGVLQVLGRDR